ncbi:MAG: methylmalonyl-CoA mutase [Candidatus Omnitrophica bacterium]|nr:methylmalonyl-CoA mutase [Candidatus Omnitrophota bacterium]
MTSSRRNRTYYTPNDFPERGYAHHLGDPGTFPFTRGIHPTMYRQKPWTIREFAGFGTAEETNKRFHLLLAEGQMGLSVAFDMPTLMGVDSDSPRAEGEVGRCGVAIDTLQDMEDLFKKISLDRISTSMTINGPAIVMLAFYIACAQKQGASLRRLKGTLQNDILKEYIAQREWIFPPRPSLKLVVDVIEHCTHHLPLWNTISISGYHIREAGSTAAQELAFTLADGFTYVEESLKRGLAVDHFAPRLSFFFNAHLNFLEEIAKFRAARRIWAKKMRNEYKAKKKRSWLLRFHTQTAGCTLTRQQPENNIVRTAYEALSAVLGGTQSLHTNSMDEQLALPTEKAVRIALRTQQILLHEIGITEIVDPLAGSYAIECLTDRLEHRAEEYFRRIQEKGGVVPALEQGFFQKEIAHAARCYQREIEQKKRIIVGVNAYLQKEESEIPLLTIGAGIERKQVARLKRVRKMRSPQKVRQALEHLGEAAKTEENLMESLVEAAHAYATLGEIVEKLKRVFGEYHQKPIF